MYNITENAPATFQWPGILLIALSKFRVFTMIKNEVTERINYTFCRLGIDFFILMLFTIICSGIYSECLTGYTQYHKQL